MKPASHNAIYWVIASLCIALTPQLASMPPHLVPLTLLPVAWRVTAEVRGWKPLHLVLRITATVIVTFVLITTYGTLMGRRVAISLLAVMLALKLLETFRVRDARVVSSLSLFLCTTQFLFSQGIPMLAYGAACTISSLAALALLHRKQAFAPLGDAPPAGRSMLTELRFSGGLLMLAMPIGLALFLFFPRWGSPLWGVPEEALDSKTGLSDSMTPGSIQNLFMDDTPAFRANFETVTPSQRELYWRGPVFWNYDGRTWTGSHYARNILAEARPEIRTAPWRYTVQLEPSEQHWMFALDYPAIVPRGVNLTLDYQLYSSRPITQLRSYQMVSNPNFVDTPTLKTTLRLRSLNLPDGFNPRTRELMRRWRAETPDHVELVNRVLAHFNSDEFYYTLNPPLLSRHTVDEFLFDTRSGFCEHYASAFTVMMRMAGIPARVVTGYQGGWYNDFGRYLLVRQSDAHAWSEVWLPGSGWTQVDPTAAVAPSRIEQNALTALGARRYLFDYTWVRSMRNGFDLLQRGWNEWVIAYNFDRQSRLFMPFGMGFMDYSKLVVMLVLVVALLTTILLPLILRMKDSGRTDAAGRLWQRFRKQLQAQGVETRLSMGPMELAGLAGAQLKDFNDEIHGIADLYTRIRYAQESPEVSELDRAIRGFRRKRLSLERTA